MAPKVMLRSISSSVMSTGKRHPNILWVSFEDTNPFYGCYGDKVARTPNLDRLAAEGCVWKNAFSTAGVCAPARSAVITGMYPISIGTHQMRTTHKARFPGGLPTPYSAVVPHYVKCFSEYLRAEGYYCTNNIKTDYQFTPPVTAWDECARDAHWRNRPDPDQPFFAVFNLNKTHESGMWEDKPEPAFDPDDMVLPPYFPDTPKVRKSMARMYTNIEYNDKLLGEFLDQLEEDGLAENTIVFNWSDHGPMPRGKRWPYDSGIHVPMIIRWPEGLEPGTVKEDLVSTVDLGPTVMSLCGIDVPQYMQGQAFLGAQAKPVREYVYAARDRHDEGYDMVRAVRDKRFKYMRHYCPDVTYLPWVPYRNTHPIVQEWWRIHMEGKLEGDEKVMFEKKPAEELYDTVADPWEVNNLAKNPEFGADLARLRTELDRFLREAGDMGNIDEADMVRRWYPNGKQPRTMAPVLIPICGDSPGTELSADGGEFTGPVLLQLHCPTQGGSIAYTFEEGEDARWNLYRDPIRLELGSTRIRAKAIRIGFAESEESTGTFVIR